MNANDELEVIRKKAVMVTLRYYTNIYLEGMREKTKVSLDIASF